MEASVESPVPRKNEGRKKETYTLDPETVRKLKEYNERTGVPMGRVIDKAVAAYLSPDKKAEP